MISNFLFTAEKKFDTNCSLLPASIYVAIPYGMIHLLTNKVAALFISIMVIGMALVSFLYRSVKTITCWLQDLVFGNGPKCPLAEVLAVQRLEDDVAASHDGFSYLCRVRLADSHCSVCDSGHMRPGIFALQCIVKPSLGWVTSEDSSMRQVQCVAT